MATLTPRRSLVPFTPTAADPRELERRTVGRSEVLDQLLDGARAATRGLDRAHTLLVAPRGGGKTHVLTLFVHRLRNEHQLARALAVVVIAEDAVEIASYLDLLVAVVEALGDRSRADRARELRRDGERAELERLVLEVLDRRPLVLVVENLDRVFQDLGAQGQRELRAFVETSRAVMLVASTPALFHGVSRRTEPWFGSFAVERLAPWSLDEGAAFLARVAFERDDAELAARIESPLGQARLRAIEGLVGGLPRLWTILASCITVELLDELVPLVLATLEELVPYYQARLNELAPGERKLVVALCRAETLGSRSGRTVRELALAAGVPESSAPKLLRRLEEAGWVVPTKPDGTDRRATWYEIREPLLRYHVAYRRQAEQPLAVIVLFLRAWFSPAERRHHLAGARAGSAAEAYVLESLRGVPRGSDDLYNTADPIDLLAGAREWFSAETGAAVGVRSRLAAIVAEAVALVALGQSEITDTTVAARLEQVDVCYRDLAERTVRAAIDAARASASTPSTAAQLSARQRTVQAGLDAAMGPAMEAKLQDEIAVALVAHGWRGSTGDDEGAYRALMKLLDRAGALDEQSVALRLAVEAEAAYFGCRIGERARELDRMKGVRDERERLLGSDHPDTLTSRMNVAGAIGEADHTAARDLYAALISDRERVLGPDHPNTLTSRHNHAYLTAEAGDHTATRDLYAALISDRERVLGPDHPNTLTSRAVALAYIASRVDRLEATLSLLARPCPRAVETLARQVLDSLFVDPTTLAIDRAQERAALRHLLSSPSAGPGLLALVTRAAAAPHIAQELVAATDDEPASQANLTTAIVTAVAGQRWTRSALRAWIDSWLMALADRPLAEVARSMLDVIGREADGDATARPSLPPELRTILPRVRVVADED